MTAAAASTSLSSMAGAPKTRKVFRLRIFGRSVVCTFSFFSRKHAAATVKTASPGQHLIKYRSSGLGKNFPGFVPGGRSHTPAFLVPRAAERFGRCRLLAPKPRIAHH